MRQRANPLADAATAKCELAAEVLRSFDTLRFSATGWSMLPTVWSGDTLVVERVSPDCFRVGDIALVGREGRLCAHRVVCLSEGSGNRFWITRGDAMARPDRPVMEGELLGRVTELIRSGKSIAVSAKLGLIERLTAQIIRRSAFAARVFIYMTSRIRTQSEPRLSCQE
jgi:hypothetical protein